MKKTDIALIVGVVVVILLACLIIKPTKAEKNYELPLTLTGDAGLTELSYDEYQEKIDNNEAFVVIISRETCSHCQNFLPVAEEFAEDNDLPMYYVDTDTFDDDEWTELETSNTFFKKNSSSWGTPTTLVLVGSECLDYIEGETDADSLLELYSDYFDLDAVEE